MTPPPRHKRIETIFLEAAEAADAAEREAILARDCGDDAALRAHVERLLAADAANAADASIGQSVAEFPAEPTPRQIGAYAVHAIAGEGGMGAVYEATHEPTGRRAAVKLVRAGISSLRGRERMRVEAETLGRLNSPNVAQVYDAGIAEVTFTDGTRAHRPFIAMEFVDGVSISEYDAAHPRPLEQQLALFEQVARAIHHAHQRGVIHRDLKPSNILVTADGVPKVVDFGIARFVDLATEGITISGQVLGTARYMSPEQAGGDASRVDTRTDVYALGAILYELLAKRPVVDVGTGSSLGSLIRVLNAVPPRLATLQPTTPRDVDAIVHKAIERDPDHRYGSAQMLADDLERFRTGREVTARAPGPIERTLRLIRRNRAISAAAAVAILAIVGGSAVSLWQARAAIRQEQATARALGEAQASLAYLTDLLASCTPERDGRNARVLDVAVKAAADIEGRFKDRPLVLSEVRLALGRTFLALGKGQDALRALDAAYQQRLQLLGPDDLRTVEAEAALDEAALNVGHGAVQNRDFERPHQWFAAHLGPVDRRTLRAQLTAAEARAVLKRGPDPFALVQATANTFEQTYGPDDQDTLDAKTTLAFWLLDRRDDPDAVIKLLTPMIELETRQFGASNARTLHCIWLLAGACNVTGDNARAIALLEPAMPAFDEVYGEDHPEAVLAQRSLAVAYLAAGRNDRAEAALQRAIAGSAVAFGDADGRTQSIRIRLGQWLTDQGRLDESEQLIRTVFDQEMHAQLAAAHYGLAMDAQGRLLLARGRPAEAAIRFHGAIDVFAADRWDRTRADAVEGLGLCMQRLDRPADAAVCFADAAESYARRMGEQHPNTLRVRAELDAARAASDRLHATPTLVSPIASELRDNVAAWQVQVARIALEEGQAQIAAIWLQRATDRAAKLDPPDAAMAVTIQELLTRTSATRPAPQ